MKRVLLLAFLACCNVAAVQAASSVLIEVDLGRTYGLFKKSPVVERAILVKPETPTDTVILFFRGYPGIERIDGIKGHVFTPPFMRYHVSEFMQNGIALVLMDCPTDQWNSCQDHYRSSPQHAGDVRKIMAKLRQEHGLTRFYLMGHSMGSVSSRWLAVNLGSEIAGSIHSGSMNRASPDGYASSTWNIPYDKITTPVVHVHNQDDSCDYTPYSAVKKYAGQNLITVRGGNKIGDPCKVHLHSFDGREEGVAKAIVKWVKTGTVEKFVEQ